MMNVEWWMVIDEWWMINGERGMMNTYMQKVVCDSKAKFKICIKGTCYLTTYGDNTVMDIISALPIGVFSSKL